MKSTFITECTEYSLPENTMFKGKECSYIVIARTREEWRCTVVPFHCTDELMFLFRRDIDDLTKGEARKLAEQILGVE